MKVEIGNDQGPYGTVEVVGDALHYTGDVAKLQRIIANLQEYYTHYTPAQLLADMPRMYNNGYHWSRVVKEDEP